MQKLITEIETTEKDYDKIKLHNQGKKRES